MSENFDQNNENQSSKIDFEKVKQLKVLTAKIERTTKQYNVAQSKADKLKSELEKLYSDLQNIK